MIEKTWRCELVSDMGQSLRTVWSSSDARDDTGLEHLHFYLPPRVYFLLV